MFARNLSIQLKPNSQAEFTRTFEKDVLPLLRKQKGFQDEISLCNKGGMEVTSISLWDSKENAELYNTSVYPEILKTLSNVVEGTPKIRTSDLVISSFHKLASTPVGVAV